MHDDLLHVTLWKHISFSCVHINSFYRKHRLMEGSRVWTFKMTACEHTEGSKTLYFFRCWFSKSFEGVHLEEYCMNGSWLFIEVLITGIVRSIFQKMRPVYRLFKPIGKIVIVPSQVIIIIFVHWIFHNIIIILFKLLLRIIPMVFFISRIGWWCFCGTYIGCLLMSDIFTNLQNPLKN